MTNNTYTLEAKDSTSYEAGYKIFLKRSDFRDRIAFKFAQLVKGIDPAKSLKVLDVGCGNGEMTQKYLQPLKLITNNIELTLFEPAHASLEQALNILKGDATITAAGTTPPHNQNFDLIIASYVFYHISGSFLVNLTNQLSISGSLAIMMGTSNNPFKTHPNLKGTTNHGSTDKLEPFLLELEQTSNFKITRHKVDTHLDLEGLRNETGMTDEGRTLLTFSLNKDYGSLSKDALTAVDEIYKEAFKKDGGKAKSVHEIIWIERIK